MPEQCYACGKVCGDVEAKRIPVHSETRKWLVLWFCRFCWDQLRIPTQ